MVFPSQNHSYYPQSTAMPQQQVLYTSHQNSPPSNQSWMSLPLYSQQQNTYQPSLPPNNPYSSLDTSIFSPGGEVIPPTPQTSEPSSYYDSMPNQHTQQGYLTTTTPSHANSYSSHESNATSISSLSRSCSPTQLTCTASSNAFTYSTSPETTETAGSYVKRSNSTYQNRQATPSPPSQPLYHSSSNPLHSYGIPVPASSSSAVQTWRCAYPSCSSRALFTRGCDLRKHFNRHSKHLFCRVKGCPQSAPRLSEDSQAHANGWGRGLGPIGGGGGFSSKKDRARHEAKHNPKIMCEWIGEGGERCGRKFSRADNMKDHVRRIHRKGQANAPSQAPAQVPVPKPDQKSSPISLGEKAPSVHGRERTLSLVEGMEQGLAAPLSLAPLSASPPQIHYLEPVVW